MLGIDLYHLAEGRLFSEGEAASVRQACRDEGLLLLSLRWRT